jgi:rhodanese-related sulfurtransferase
VADELGYKNVHDYRGGIKEWHEAGLPVEGELASN